MMIRDQGHREVKQSFLQNLGSELIRMCDEKEKEIRIDTVNKRDNNDMRHHGDKVVMKVDQIASVSVK